MKSYFKRISALLMVSYFFSLTTYAAVSPTPSVLIPSPAYSSSVNGIQQISSHDPLAELNKPIQASLENPWCLALFPQKVPGTEDY